MLLISQRDMTTVLYQSRKYSQIPVILQIHWIQTNDEHRAHAAIRCGVLAQGSTLPTMASIFLSKKLQKERSVFSCDERGFYNSDHYRVLNPNSTPIEGSLGFS